jgi:pentatricopeptide repeat protein
MELGFLQRKRACPQNETILNPTIFSSQSPKQGADFNYLRFALLCRSDNLEKVRDLFNEMKEKCIDVKLIQEVVKLYDN